MALPPALAVCAALVIASQATSGAKKAKSADPTIAFDELFRPVEQAMGIDIKASKMKLNLLSGEVTVGSILLAHPKQGKVATASSVHFPFGALIGVSDPMKASTVMEKLRLKIDFGGDRFWRVTPPGGGPIPGAPSLEIGNLDVRNGAVELAHGNGPTVRLTGFKARLNKLKVPGKVWSRGQVPTGRWAEATLSGGQLKIDNLDDAVQIDEASFHFTSTKFHISSLEGSLAQGGKVTLKGTVDMSSGRPSLYDLTVEIDKAKIERPDVQAVASGRLTLKGPPGGLKVYGKLALSNVGMLRAAKWSRKPCSGKTKISVTLVPEKGSKYKKAKMKGSLCQGRITFK
jgi:hypothetical protein